MKFIPKFITLAVMIATAQFSAYANSETERVADSSMAHAVSAPIKAPIAIQSPTDWIIYDDTTYTPVADEVSRHLDAARKAFDAKSNSKAAAELHAVADALKKQYVLASNENKLEVNADKAQLDANTKRSHEISKFMDEIVLKVNTAASDIESGKIKTQADLDKVFDKAAQANLERRWLVSDVNTWYPVSEEPQHHFTEAVVAFANKDYKNAAIEIRKATSYIRLEARRAAGDVKLALDGSVTDLDKLALSVEQGTVKDEKSMDKAFAKANHGLALAHRAKAAESWAVNDYNKAGYELKVAAHGLESAAGWVGGEAKAGGRTAEADTKALGSKLISGTNWTRNEVAKGFESLGNRINTLGHKIGIKQQAVAVKSDS